MPDFDITFDPGPHRYYIDGEPVPSVTQILDIIDRSGPLIWWGQGIGVKGVCELVRMGEEFAWDDPEGIVKLLTQKKMTTNHQRDKAGTRGTSLHDALEQYLALGTVPNAANFPGSDRGFVQALAKALLALRPDPIEAEVIVGSKQHGFAGRFDLLATVDGAVTRLDLKTGKGVYPESHFPQLAAYEGAAVECGRQPSERQCVLRLGADGEWELVESCATFADFLAIKGAYHAVRGINALVAEQRKKARQEAKAAA